MMFYRQLSSIEGAEEQPSILATLLQKLLERSGSNVWMDKKDLSVATQELKYTIYNQMRKTTMAILSMGVGDLERCSDEGDFFRWEIDRVRELEKEKVLQVAVVVHGTKEVEDLICGTSSTIKHRKSALASLGTWGEDLLEYLRNHWIIFFEIDKLDQVISRLQGESGEFSFLNDTV
jgi:hypothetical protein